MNRLTLASLVVVAAVLSAPIAAQAATRTVAVGSGGADTFSPKTVTVDAGDSVKWTWASRRTHNVTARSFTDSGSRSRGSFSVRFARAGRFGYVCTLHDGMSGTVVVRR